MNAQKPNRPRHPVEHPSAMQDSVISDSVTPAYAGPDGSEFNVVEERSLGEQLKQFVQEDWLSPAVCLANIIVFAMFAVSISGMVGCLSLILIILLRSCSY